MTSKALKAAAAAVVVGIAAYWYWSPLLAIRQMQTAARAGDADTFNDHVDYPRLRESLKGQFSAMLTKRLGGQPDAAEAILRKRAPLWEPCSAWQWWTALLTQWFAPRS